MVRKTPKRSHSRSDHTVNTQQQILCGTITVELPLDLLVYEVLTRLPVKTLCRFRCVSKPLRSFISDPDFHKLHATRSQQTPLLLVAKSDTTGVHLSTHTILGGKLLKDFFITFPPPSYTILKPIFVLEQSCRGLVCLSYKLNGFDGSILVFNPSTGDVIHLPECPNRYPNQSVGFGYSDSSDEFKVVRYFAHDEYGEFFLADGIDDFHNQVCFSEVFTLGSSDGWRETMSPPFIPLNSGHLPLVHGALHFLPSLTYHDYMRDDHYISAFDVGTEQYRGIPLPEIYSGFEATGNDRQCHLAELRGSLCMSFNFFKSKKLLQLWFLKDHHGGKWVKEYNISLSYEPSPSSPFAVTDDGCVLLRILFPENERKFCYYSAQKNCITKMFGANCSAMFYFDSFLPLPLFGK